MLSQVKEGGVIKRFWARADNMPRVAAEQRLETCWRGGGFGKKVVKEASGISEKICVVSLKPLGYPDEMTEPRPRKTLEEMTSGNYWA